MEKLQTSIQGQTVKHIKHIKRKQWPQRREPLVAGVTFCGDDRAIIMFFSGKIKDIRRKGALSEAYKRYYR